MSLRTPATLMPPTGRTRLIADDLDATDRPDFRKVEDIQRWKPRQDLPDGAKEAADCSADARVISTQEGTR